MHRYSLNYTTHLYYFIQLLYHADVLQLHRNQTVPTSLRDTPGKKKQKAKRSRDDILWNVANRHLTKVGLMQARETTYNPLLRWNIFNTFGKDSPVFKVYIH